MASRWNRNWFFGVLSVIFLAGPMMAAEYHVSTSGNDSGPGTVAQPWRTLQKAADEVGAGDMVVVHSGSYQGFRSRRGGTPGSPITMRAGTGEAVTVNAPGPQSIHGSVICLEGDDTEEHGWWVLEGLEVTGATQAAAIDVRGVEEKPITHVTVRNCHLHHNARWGLFTAFSDDLLAEGNECDNSSAEHGIYVSNSSDRATLRGNYCHDNRCAGIQINADPSMGGDGISSGCLITGNRIMNNGAAGGAGINLASVRDCLIADNLVTGNHATGIALWDDGQGNEWGSQGNRILFNTVSQATGARWAISLLDGSTGNRISGNLFFHPGGKGGIAIDSSSLVGLASDNNILAGVELDDEVISLATWQSGHGQDPHSSTRTEAETFQSPGTDFHLLSTAWAVDHGQTDTGSVSTDLDGKVRVWGTSSDIGCYEWQPATRKGDLNGDGFVNAADAMLLASWLAGNSVSPVPGLDTGDMDGDGALTVADGIRILLPSVVFSQVKSPCAETMAVRQGEVPACSGFKAGWSSDGLVLELSDGKVRPSVILENRPQGMQKVSAGEAAMNKEKRGGDRAPSIPGVLPVPLVGDLNGDQTVDAADAAILAGWLAGNQTSVTITLGNADMDGDGELGVGDVLRMMIPSQPSQGWIHIDHSCTVVGSIPQEWITAAKNNLKIHYCGKSHSAQVGAGLNLLAASIPSLNYASGYCTLPSVTGALCIHRGQVSDDLIGYESYWKGTGLNTTRQVLQSEPSLNVTMFCWCRDLFTMSEADVATYLAAMQTLESEFPGLRAVYFTSNAEKSWSDDETWNRFQRNRQIREYCQANGKVLYDFEDLDSWYWNASSGSWEHSTILIQGQNVPVLHGSFVGEYEYSHTSQAGCEQKARAFWWMAARLAGWSGN